MKFYSPKLKKIIISYLIFVSIIFLSFDIFPASAENVSYVYVGGDIIGFEAEIGGALVTRTASFDVGEWEVFPSLKCGDVIKKINGINVYDAEEIGEILNGDDIKIHDEVMVEVLRNGTAVTEKCRIIYDRNSNKKILGVEVKDVVCGLGTITFVTKSGEFCGLGHEIVDFDTGYAVYSKSGRVVKSCVNGIVKGKTGCPGTIKGYLGNSKLGLIENNGKFGIKGRIESGVMEGSDIMRLGGKKDTAPGNAKICSTISGKKEYYDIKIIKTFIQNAAAEKSMIIKISDSRLIELTGGIVQGMSGSPIIQNGAVVGAVTHVFTNDPTMGYGVYADWQC